MWTHKHTAILGGVSAASLAAGFALGSWRARRAAEAEFQERLEKEVTETARFYQSIHKPDVDPEELAKRILEVEDPAEAEDYQVYETSSKDIPQEVLDKIREAEEELEAEAQPAEHNAFENPAPSWVQEDEELERRNGVPYIISEEEFLENKLEFEEGQLTFYEADGTLTDSRDEVIPNPEQFVGPIALDGEHWGYGCQDPNQVHVCNEQAEMIFEISRSTKSYAEDVLGFIEPVQGKELRHSARRDFRQGRDE